MNDTQGARCYTVLYKYVQAISRLFNSSEFVTAAVVDNGRFKAFSDWRLHGNDAFTRVVVQGAPGGPPLRRTAAAKVLQRVARPKAAAGAG